jgi:hypothetical protein
MLCGAHRSREVGLGVSDAAAFNSSTRVTAATACVCAKYLACLAEARARYSSMSDRRPSQTECKAAWRPGREKRILSVAKLHAGENALPCTLPCTCSYLSAGSLPFRYRHRACAPWPLHCWQEYQWVCPNHLSSAVSNLVRTTITTRAWRQTAAHIKSHASNVLFLRLSERETDEEFNALVAASQPKDRIPRFYLPVRRLSVLIAISVGLHTHQNLSSLFTIHI